MSEHYDYDVIIIGAGISGLVCGCYLAKAGKKVLIIEKNAKPGGYCTSFTRQGYHFDACVHMLSSLREGGKLEKICKSLGMFQTLRFKKNDPSDIIYTPNFKIAFYRDLNRTIDELRQFFPKERFRIKKFFEYIAYAPLTTIMKLRSKTFKQVMDSYIEDEKLKTIFSTLILSLVGWPALEVSAFVACLILREFVFDGGYYPKGGMQVFADSLVAKFAEFKGEVIFSKAVKKIIIEKNNARGILLDDTTTIFSKYVVSACDATHTFLELASPNIDRPIIDKLNSLVPSLSVFSLYIGLTNDLRQVSDLKSNIWVIDNYDSRHIYSSLLNCKNKHLAITSSSIKDESLSQKKSACISTNVPYKSKSFWEGKITDELTKKLLMISEKVIPQLSKFIAVKIIATPVTLHHWTRNHQGAAYGWASTPAQFCDPDMSQITRIKNLYLTGHWSNQSSGITSVANCGYGTAEIILKK